MTSSSSAVPHRRKTQRACDQCRRRKTRCNGEPQCGLCTDTGLQCSYGYRIKQTSGPKYVAHLEQKVLGLEARLRSASSGESSQGKDDRPSLSINAANHLTASLPALSLVDSALSMPFLESDAFQFWQESSSSESFKGLVEILGTSHPDELAGSDDQLPIYRGRTTGVGVLRDLRHLCDSFIEQSSEPNQGPKALIDALDASIPVERLATASTINFFPSEAAVSRWIDLAFEQAFVLWPFIDRESLNGHVQRLIGPEVSDDTSDNRDSFGLVHAVIALGQRHDTNLISSGDRQSQSTETRGIRHFAAARELVPLADCSRSVTAVQTVMCMALYLRSVNAQRAVHTYISTACYAVHQLGLHDSATAVRFSSRDQAVRQRVYMTLRVFDAYTTSFLGLPRNISATDFDGETIAASHLATQEMLTAASANAELLAIFNHAREKVYLTAVSTSGHGSIMVDTSQLHEFDTSLAQWMPKHQISIQGSTADCAATCPKRTNGHRLQCCCHLLTESKPTLFLNFSRCFVLLVFYSPLLHHIVKPAEDRNPSGHAAATRCVEAAMEAVAIAETMGVRGLLYEAFALTIDVLAMAATSLLVVELGAADNPMAVHAGVSSRKAKTLLESLAWQNFTAARCLKSLTPLYVKVATHTNIVAPPLVPVSQDPVRPCAISTQAPLWNFAPPESNAVLAFDPTEMDELMSFPSHDDPAASTLPFTMPAWWDLGDFADF